MRKNIKFYGGETVNTEKNESVGYLVTLASRKLLRNIETGLKPFNLTAKQWAPLLALANERCNTVAGCARETGIDNGAMTRMLDRLEVKGFVSRKRSNNDRRVVNIAKDIPPVISEVLNQQLRGFSEQEFNLIKNLLQRFLINGETLAEQS